MAAGTRSGVISECHDTRADGRLVALGFWSARHRALVLILTLLATATAIVWGHDAESHLSAGSWYPPTAGAVHADAYLARHFRAGEANLVLTAQAAKGVDSAEAVRAGRRTAAFLAQRTDPVYVRSYWDTREPGLRDATGHTALVVAKLRGSDAEVLRQYRRIEARFTGRHDGLVLRATGTVPVHAALTEWIRRDQVRAELLTTVPLVGLLWLIVRSWICTLLPALVGGCGAAATNAALKALASVTEISVFAVGIATGLAFALAVDYSLFLTLRYREELRGGAESCAALATSMRTAGRTVIVSALVVASSMAAFWVFPSVPLRSIALAGCVIVPLVGAAALLIVPAGLACLGPGSRGRMRQPGAHASSAFWRRLGQVVVRHPLPVVVPTVGFLVLLATPFLGVSFGLTDDRALPASAPVRLAADRVRAMGGSMTTSPYLVLPHWKPEPDGNRLDGYARALSAVPNVRSVTTATGTYAAGRRTGEPPAGQRYTNAAGTWLAVASDSEPFSSAGKSQLARLREVPSPASVLVGGSSALQADTVATLRAGLPTALTLVGVTSFCLLAWATRSLLLPVKALVLNCLSLSAAFGAIVYVFQRGHGRALFGDFTVTGFTDITEPLLVLCVAFGLSMDYELLLLSHAREEYDRTRDNTTAALSVLRRSGPLITSAAAVILIVFAGVATSDVKPLKVTSVGVALAVTIDATLIRMLLAPAVIRLAGRANWWFPAVLVRGRCPAGHRKVTGGCTTQPGAGGTSK
ncbi:MMPL family transporter [Streptomyces mirabilis]|nr:MMPL family transporter [Streptomyces mirabilis]